MRSPHPESEKNVSISIEPKEANEVTIPTNADLEKARIEYEIAKNNAQSPVVRRSHPQSLKAISDKAKRKLESIEKAMEGNMQPVKLDDYSDRFPIEKYPIAEVRDAFIETEKATEAHLAAMRLRWEVLRKYNLPENWRG